MFSVAKFLQIKQVNLAEQEIRGWAWNCGAAILPLLLPLVEKCSVDHGSIPATAREIATQIQNQKYAKRYDAVRELLDELTLDARLIVKLPKTLSALRRESEPFRRIERDYYREFLRYGIAVAEVLPFALKIGVMGCVTGDEPYSEAEKQDLLVALEKASRRAEEDYSKYEELFHSHLDGSIESSQLVSRAAGLFYRDAPDSRRLWNRIADAVMVSPNFAGIGIDLKKLSD